jgi:hypothetical protein
MHPSEVLTRLDWSDPGSVFRTLEREREHAAMMCAEYVLDGDLEYAGRWAQAAALWDARLALTLYGGVMTLEDTERRDRRLRAV